MDKELLINTLRIQSTSFQSAQMEKYITDFLTYNSIPFYVDKTGNIYATKGQSDLYPCIVSHIDTVHDLIEPENFNVVELKGNLFAYDSGAMQPTGIGGDDKVGVFVCLSLLLSLPHCKAAFFVDEEIGCVGSYEADMKFFTDCSLVTQCDRKGNKHIVATACGVELMTDKQLRDIEVIGYYYNYSITHSGGMTDVMALKEIGLNVACMNIECGYYNPHTESEYVNIQDVENCLLLCTAICLQLGKDRQTHKTRKRKIYTPTWKTSTAPKGSIKSCECCFESKQDVKYHAFYQINMCAECQEWADVTT